MKLKPVYIVVIVIILIILYFGYSMMKSGKSMTQTMTEKVAEKVMGAVSLTCDYTDGKSTSKMYVKNKMVRADSVTNGKSSHVIVKLNQMWVWDDEKKEGMTWVLPTPNTKDGEVDFSSLGAAATTGINMKALMEAGSENNTACKPTAVDDGLFQAPSDVKFSSFDEMMKGVGLPQGSAGESGAVSNEMQRLIQEQMKKAGVGQ